MTPPLVELELADHIATITLARPDKRNAMNDALLADLERALIAVPEGIRAIVLAGRGGHFCAGLDLSELERRTPAEVVAHSQSWQRVFTRIQLGGIPAIAALHGGVIGGGLELAAATHIRVAEPDTFFQLPEGRHGIFVGGGASVRVARIIGTGRMCEMMLTNRRVDVDEAHALGLVHYRVGAGEGLDEARRLAEEVSQNAPISNYAITTVLPRIGNMASDDGMLVESLTAALSSTDTAARERIGAFLHRRRRDVAAGGEDSPESRIDGRAFIVTGGASGLGAATALALRERGANVGIGDLAAGPAQPDPGTRYRQTDIRDEVQVAALINEVIERYGRLDGVVNCAGIGISARVLGREEVHSLDLFRRCVETNLIGTFNVIRLAVAAMARAEPGVDGERGVVVNTASVAAFEGQIGQAAYAASKGGIVSMTLPLAREFARIGVRVVTIAPGLFATPMIDQLSREVQQALADSVPFPRRLGEPGEFAALACHVIENPMLNGETIRLDGALRLAPR